MSGPESEGTETRGTGDAPVGRGAGARGGQALLDVYDDALPAVFGYVYRRCPDRRVAEDVTSETFLAALDTVRRDPTLTPGVAWLIGVARHKLADHWRRVQRTPEPVDELPDPPPDGDEWDIHLDRILAHHTLAQLTPVHRAVLTLRYVDDLPVAECAAALDRGVGATEALLTRAKRAFRAAYPDRSVGIGREGGRA